MKNPKIHKIFILIIIAIVLLMIKYVYNSAIMKKAFDEADIVTIGKTLNIEIKEEDLRDYTFIQTNNELSKWNESERNKFIYYMRKYDSILKPGNYNINQGTKWEKALEIFEID